MCSRGWTGASCLARRFQHVAATGLMVLRNSEPGRRVRVGGMNWVSTRLYPLVKAACPDHPLLRETRREVLEDLLDVPAAEALAQRPAGGAIPLAARPNRRSRPPGSSRARPIRSSSNPRPKRCGGCTRGWCCKRRCPSAVGLEGSCTPPPNPDEAPIAGHRASIFR